MCHESSPDLESFLNRDWPWAGFAIGDLEPDAMSLCEWRRHRDSLILLFNGLTPRLLVHYGDGDGLAELLAGVDEPRVWANIRPDCEEIFFRFFRPASCVRMRRMYLDQAVAPVGEAVRLSAGDRAEVEELINQGEWVLFLPHMLDSGHYFGIREGGRLVAVAGVHLASTRFDIAALGTVFTHPDARGKGYARITSSHVLASTRAAGIRRVVLNVEESKTAACGVYERLGFQTHCVYLDGECARLGIGDN